MANLKRKTGRPPSPKTGARAVGKRVGNRPAAEQLNPLVPSPEKLILGSGMNSLLPAKERQAKWNLTETEDVFARMYVETGDFRKAHQAAGVHEDTAKRYLTYERVWAFIEKYLSICLTRGAVIGYNLVMDLAQQSTSDTLKFKAASWLYDKWENRILRDAGVFSARTDTPNDLNAIQERIGELSKVLNLNIQVNVPAAPKGNGEWSEN